MEGESIFNDALAIVFYLIAVEVAFGEGGDRAPRTAAEFGARSSSVWLAGPGVGLGAHRLMATSMITSWRSPCPSSPPTGRTCWLTGSAGQA